MPVHNIGLTVRMTTDKILVTRRLSKQYQKRYAVRNLDLEVIQGDIFGFLGPNGAGKSTTIRMLLSLIKPTAGDVQLFGYSVLANRSKALRRVGGIVEKPDFYQYLSAARNLEVLGALNGGVTRKRIMEVLGMVGLEARALDRVKTYSHGMKQRLGIAQALLHDPDLIILDEPTNGLDPQGMKEIRELIVYLARDRRKTVFLSSHLLSEIELVANRMAIISQGELAIQGNVQELIDHGEQYVIIRGRPGNRIRQVLSNKRLGIKSFKEEKSQFVAMMKFGGIPELTRRLVNNGVHVQALIPRRSLEDFFLSITESSSIA